MSDALSFSLSSLRSIRSGFWADLPCLDPPFRRLPLTCCSFRRLLLGTNMRCTGSFSPSTESASSNFPCLIWHSADRYRHDGLRVSKSCFDRKPCARVKLPVEKWTCASQKASVSLPGTRQPVRIALRRTPDFVPVMANSLSPMYIADSYWCLFIASCRQLLRKLSIT